MVNARVDKCHIVPYGGGGVGTMAIDLLDDSNKCKAADGLPDEPGRDGIKSALLERRLLGGDDAGMMPCGDIRKDFEVVYSPHRRDPGGGRGRGDPDTLLREHIPIPGIHPRT